MITVDAVIKVYRSAQGEVRALDGVSLSVARGEFVAVRGPSGCGKTTLLLTAGGMVRPTAGRVLLGGQDVYALSRGERAQVRARQIGFVFQMFHLVPYLSVVENVLLSSLAVPPPPRQELLELLDRLRLTDRLGHKPAQLSTGERQRVALARALLHRPPVLLADEPTGNLDPDHAVQVMEILAEYHAGGGTVLLVTHSQLADEVAQRTLHMAAGRMEAPGGTAGSATGEGV